ncbi:MULTISPECIES: McrB family protein [Bacillaceae]|uniref:McrB family protein n=1 Tax=Bacillaceae TaxID=186817 RepID=UPI001CEF8A50|nr:MULTISPECIES: AAA family ATPase [Bacillaceae]
MNYWWVNQGKNHKNEREKGYLWAPKTNKIGHKIEAYELLNSAKVGDLVICYSDKYIKSIGFVVKEAITATRPSIKAYDQWNEEGYYLKLNYFDMDKQIERNEIPLNWRINEGGPFNATGELKMRYFHPISEDFFKKVYYKFSNNFSEDLKKILGEKMKFTEISNDKTVIKHIYNYICNKGFYYLIDDVANLLLSIKAKPFVIFSGISGTGKTKMIQWFAESLGANEINGQLAIIPVRPDWNDGSDLLGYVDIKGEFKEGPLTKVIRQATDNSNDPYFVLLDEMNLARVEHYFSDILSIMESRKWKDGKLTSSPLLSQDITNFKEDLYLPSNVYVIGTVNMDETTHPFSKKVLDRANTIEFNRVELSNFSFLEDLEETEPMPISNQVLESKYLHLKDVYKEYKDLVKKTTMVLEEINNELRITNAHVGYRVRDEICFYLAYNESGDLMEYEQALDYCILQKILPRISGSDSRIETLLKGLYRIFTQRELDDNQEDLNLIDTKNALYPQSTRKVIEMLGRLRVDGFTSFWV